MRGYRFLSVPVPRESVASALLVLARYGFIVEGSAKAAGDRVTYTLDMARLPDGEADCAELIVKREVEKAVSLHTKG